jgi:leucyl aminopeptidase (aminopeptidase T)
MRIGRKPNPGVALARKRFGRTVDRFLRMKTFSREQLSEKELKIAKKLRDPDYGPLVIKRNGKYQVKTEIGNTVRLVYSDVDEECVKMRDMIKEECWKVGAHITDLNYSSAEARRHLQLIPYDSAAELPVTAKLFAGAFDARIFLGADEDENWVKGLVSKVKLGAPASQRVHKIMDEKGVRWCVFGWPIKLNHYLVDKKLYRDVFIDSIRETFTERVRKLCRYYYKAMTKADKIRIKANDGTDLTFSIKGRPPLIADGVIDDEDMDRGDVGLNIPDGETFIAPLEHSANGYILFDYIVTNGFGFIKNLEIKFKDGKVVWYDADKKGKDAFKKFLGANTGEKDRIAELGIGTNPAAKFVGKTIVDEKIFGSIHIAIGNNTGAYHGKNEASSHLDMIKIMKGRNGNMYIDGKLVMKNGMPAGRV